MKRAMLGGASRGPVAYGRQQRTLRFMQILLLLVGLGLALLAGYNLGQASGYERGVRADEVGRPAKPSAGKIVALLILSATATGGGLLLAGRSGVRLPTPARLEELAGRAEEAAIRRAEEHAR